ETALAAKGANVRKAANWARNVVISDRLVTGQNPASAAGVGEAVAALLKEKSR
ncbi:MAG: type 1 glutamine amidotransferase domain-containing protein, partial [Elusimicrobiota bacterium]|nr:type 1 glutamine amidotransferase domain-containing protein [Elusimicrobiota bacterium]